MKTLKVALAIVLLPVYALVLIGLCVMWVLALCCPDCKEVAVRDRNLLLAEVRDCTISGPRNPVVVCFTSPLSSLTVI